MDEFIKSFDIFSQSFSFNTAKRKFKKRTLTGALLSVSIEKTHFTEKNQDFKYGNVEEKYTIDTVFIPSIPTKPCQNILKQFNTYVNKEGLDIDQENFQLDQIKSSQQIQTDQHQQLQQSEQINSITNRSEINQKQVKLIQNDQNNSLKDKLRLLNSKECNFIEINSLITSSQAICAQTQRPLKQIQIQSNQNKTISNIKHSSLKQPIQEEQNSDSISKLNKCHLTKITDILFKFKIRRRSEYEAKIGLNQKTKQLIEEQLDQISDFPKLYEEIIFLKKAIMILLTKEQFAALNHVGCSETFLLSDQIKKNSSDTNYFEEQFAISLLKEQQYKYFKQFISKCCNKNTKDLNLIDQRIYSSII
ncbi:hypothetical protein ABPG73_013673 [Tetrahymena malaccensis]